MMREYPLRTGVLAALGAAALGSAAILLYVSISREFVPGAVELTVAISIGIAAGTALLFGFGPRESVETRVRNLHRGRLALAVAGVGVFLATAVAALLEDDFPWPAPLILVVLLVGAAIGGPGNRLRPY